MIKLRTVLISAALVVSATAFADWTYKAHGALKGHGNLIAAEKKLHSAVESVTKSQKANECVFGVEGGHGAKAKEAIEAAEHQVWDAAEWVNTHVKDCDDWMKGPGKGKKGEKAGLPELKYAWGKIKGHSNMVAAERDLVEAYKAIGRSQEANECVFGIEGGHGQKAKEAIDAAFKQVAEAAEWVNTHAKDCEEWGKKKH